MKSWLIVSSTQVIADHELLDFTSSGLTHSNRGYAAADNPYRVADVSYDGLNFGLLEIDWDARPAPTIVMKAMNVDGSVVFQHGLPSR